MIKYKDMEKEGLESCGDSFYFFERTAIRRIWNLLFRSALVVAELPSSFHPQPPPAGDIVLTKDSGRPEFYLLPNFHYTPLQGFSTT